MPLDPPGESVMALPEEPVGTKRFAPMELRPPGLAKVASWMVPSCEAVVWPGRVAETTPYCEMVMEVAFDGMVMAGRRVSPSAVTICPWLFIWKLPERV